MSQPLTIIPARLAAARLPNKPLALIAGEPMIVHVARIAAEAAIGPVLIAAAEEEIADAAAAAGFRTVLTDPDLPSGSDRVHAALQTFDPTGVHDVIVNMQGDFPMMDPSLLKVAARLAQNDGVDIGTLVTPIHSDEEAARPQVVKAALDLAPGTTEGRALYFSRHIIPSGAGPLFHHVGIYAYKRDALTRFVQAPPSPLELREKLEQLRALSMGLRIDAALVDSNPFGVDTPEDLARARSLMEAR